MGRSGVSLGSHSPGSLIWAWASPWTGLAGQASRSLSLAPQHRDTAYASHPVPYVGDVDQSQGLRLAKHALLQWSYLSSPRQLSLNVLFYIFRIYCYFLNSVFVCMYMCMQVPLGARKRVSSLLGQELLVAVSYLTWALEPKLESSGGGVLSLNRLSSNPMVK